MKHILLLLMICILSGCGLFKKTSKDVTKHSEVTEQSSEKKTNIVFQDQSKSLEVNTSVSTEVLINGYTVKADAIKFNPDGSFDAKGNVSMTGNNEWKRNKQDSAAAIRSAYINLEQKEVETSKQSQEVKDYSKEVKSETDGWGLIFGAFGVLVVVVGVVWWLKK